jgi:hypothetical protein
MPTTGKHGYGANYFRISKLTRTAAHRRNRRELEKGTCRQATHDDSVGVHVLPRPTEPGAVRVHYRMTRLPTATNS